eukprot:TRINITY_DN10217_c1_g2_i1.p1 TRINITY_DN10217_c1_g2~~TRINITY_DN10217_c1_g2_i1.p1  ORF type:complete len:1354 (-),score=214.96 TRINITY_DN10217_c1_g2_i1:54-4115(-)
MASPVVYDVANFEGLDWYAATRTLGALLQQKGFCFIKGGADKEICKQAEQEIADLKESGRLNRVPDEATDCYFGSIASAWTYMISSPKGTAPADETGLRGLDKYLEGLANSVASCGRDYFKADALGRSRGLVHVPLAPEDPPAPPLVDPEEAQQHASHCAMRKVTLLYYLGPSDAIFVLAPRNDVDKQVQVRIPEHTVVAYMTDAVLTALDIRGPGTTIQVDVILQMKAGVLESTREMLGIPARLNDWLEERLKTIKRDEELSVSQEIPYHFQKNAHMLFFEGEPIRIVHVEWDVPNVPRADKIGTPIEAAVLGGLDTAMEIRAPPPPGTTTWKGLNHLQWFGAKWDLDEYYDPDPDRVDEFKSYSKHLNVMYRSYDTVFDFDNKMYNMTDEESLTCDNRTRMLLETFFWSGKKVFDRKVDDMVRGRMWGVYVGLTGSSQEWSFMNGHAKINKHTWANTSNAAMVSRLSYALDFGGPAVAIDTGDSSGLIAVDTAVRALREQSCVTAFASSATWISNPFELITLCAAGFISKSGRTRVFDETCDGYTKGEGVACAMLRPKSVFDKKHGRDSLQEHFGLHMGTGINSKGQSSSLAAPNASAMRDVLLRASRDAKMPLYIVDAVEANADGSMIADMVEMGVLMGALSHKDSTAQATVISSCKSHFGNTGAVSGLISFVRSVWLMYRSLHGPQIHLNQMIDLSGADIEGEGSEEGRPRPLILTEAIETRHFTSLFSVSSFGATGSSCHQLLMGEKPEKRRKMTPARPLNWWPTGDFKKAFAVFRGYYIVGTMTAWQEGLRMEEEAPGVFGYTLVMGENNWERFQIWVDEDPSKALHPPSEDDTRESTVVGPEKAPQSLCWRISGKPQTVRLINEQQHAELDMNPKPGDPIMYCVSFAGDYVPKDLDKNATVDEMPTHVLNAGMEGKPGDKYRIRLHVRGKFLRLEWFKAKGVDAVPTLGQKKFEHKYHIIGDHSYWLFKEMQSKQKGVYTAEVQLLRTRSNFQVYRDADFEQGFYPVDDDAAAGCTESDQIIGPDGLGHGRNFSIEGKVGDIFEVEFTRIVRKEQEKRSLSFKFLRHETVDFEERAKTHKYQIVGSWSDFQQTRDLKKDKETGTWWQEILIGKTGTESFQILLHCNWLAAVHPNVNDATMSDDHELEGPDDGGSGKYWTIGIDPTDGVSPGDHVLVFMETDKGLPSRVHWKKFNSASVHQEYLAAGAHRTFQRHCRLLGLIPWESNKKPARLVNPPEWYNGGRHKQAYLYTEAIVITPDMIGKQEVPEGDLLPHQSPSIQGQIKSVTGPERGKGDIPDPPIILPSDFKYEGADPTGLDPVEAEESESAHPRIEDLSDPQKQDPDAE